MRGAGCPPLSGLSLLSYLYYLMEFIVSCFLYEYWVYLWISGVGAGMVGLPSKATDILYFLQRKIPFCANNNCFVSLVFSFTTIANIYRSFSVITPRSENTVSHIAPLFLIFAVALPSSLLSAILKTLSSLFSVTPHFDTFSILFYVSSRLGIISNLLLHPILFSS